MLARSENVTDAMAAMRWGLSVARFVNSERIGCLKVWSFAIAKARQGEELAVPRCRRRSLAVQVCYGLRHTRVCATLFMDDKVVHAGMPDLSLLSPLASKRPADIATEESRRQAAGFAQAGARATTMAPFAPALGLQSQSQQQQQARKVRRCWSTELCIASSLLP